MVLFDCTNSSFRAVECLYSILVPRNFLAGIPASGKTHLNYVSPLFRASDDTVTASRAAVAVFAAPSTAAGGAAAAAVCQRVLNLGLRIGSAHGATASTRLMMLAEVHLQRGIAAENLLRSRSANSPPEKYAARNRRRSNYGPTGCPMKSFDRLRHGVPGDRLLDFPLFGRSSGCIFRRFCRLSADSCRHHLCCHLVQPSLLLLPYVVVYRSNNSICREHLKNNIIIPKRLP